MSYQDEVEEALRLAGELSAIAYRLTRLTALGESDEAFRKLRKAITNYDDQILKLQGMQEEDATKGLLQLTKTWEERADEIFAYRTSSDAEHAEGATLRDCAAEVKRYLCR